MKNVYYRGIKVYDNNCGGYKQYINGKTVVVLSDEISKKLYNERYIFMRRFTIFFIIC